MLIEISGMQKAGKSTLIEGLTFNFNLYKFPMGPVCKHFCIKPTWEMQVAKDISTLEFYSQVVKLSNSSSIPSISSLKSALLRLNISLVVVIFGDPSKISGSTSI